MNQNIKSATTAGLLGIFLGAFGVHNWYLGQKGRGIIRILILIGSILLFFYPVIMAMNTLSEFSSQLHYTTNISGPPMYPLTEIAFSYIAAGVLLAIDELWGFIEGVVILSQGDAGLARKGYKVADNT